MNHQIYGSLSRIFVKAMQLSLGRTSNTSEANAVAYGLIFGLEGLRRRRGV